MGEQDALAKALPAAGHDRLRARRRPAPGAKPSASGVGLERHQAGQRLDHAQPEAARDLMGETGRPHLRDRQAAGRQHQRRRP